MIKKIIWTCWIGGEMPELVKKCIDSQITCAKEFGYKHKIIDNDYAKKYGGRYVKECMSRNDVKGYVKSSDWLRVHAVYENSGLHLDADMEVLPGKSFDHLLDCKMFVPKDPHEHFGNAGFGAEAGDSILEYYLKRVEENYRGDGDMVYEQGVRGFSDCFYMKDISHVKILTPDYFFPMNRHSREVDRLTDNTVVLHHYADSWIDNR